MRRRKIGLVLLVGALVLASWRYYESSETAEDPARSANQFASSPDRQVKQSPPSGSRIANVAVPAKTDNIYPLPSDPGPDGLTSVLGIDSNNNGVRDDTERFIVQKYGNSERAREALFDYARVHQDWLRVKTKGEALQAAEKLHHALDCVRFVMRGQRLPNGIDKWVQASIELETLKLNTPQRARASQRTDELLAWHASDSRDADGSTCSFDPKSLKN